MNGMQRRHGRDVTAGCCYFAYRIFIDVFPSEWALMRGNSCDAVPSILSERIQIFIIPFIGFHSKYCVCNIDCLSIPSPDSNGTHKG